MEQQKVYDLEERTARFAERIRDFCVRLPKYSVNREFINQLVRAGSSPGANYIEANERIGNRDFCMKIRTCRRESKEAIYWLRLVLTDQVENLDEERSSLQKEAGELVRIFSTILKNRDCINN